MSIISRQISLTTAQGSFSGNLNSTNHVRLTDNRMVVLYNATGVQPTLNTRHFTIVDMVDGLDTDITDPEMIRTPGYGDKEPFQGFGVAVARLSDTRFVVSEPRSTGTVKLEIFDVSGTTITRVFTQNVLTNASAGNNAYSSSHVLIPLSETRFIQTYNTLVSSVLYTAYVVYNFTPAVVGPPAVAASLTSVREFRDSEMYYGSDISWQKIPGTTNVMIVTKIVNRFYISYQTYCWIVDALGAQVRPRFAVDGEPAVLGTNRMVVSKWSKQTYFKLDGTFDGQSVVKDYVPAIGDDQLYRPIVIPINNDHYLQLRREYFQEQDTAMFLKPFRRDDTNFNTASAWSAGKSYGKVVNSSKTTSRFTLPFDKRTPVVAPNNNMVWAGLFGSAYRLHVLKPTAAAEQNPPTGADPIPGPVRNLNARFTFDGNVLPIGSTSYGDPVRLLNYPDSVVGTSSVVATTAHQDGPDWTCYVSFNLPGGMNRARIRYVADSEPGFDYWGITINGVTAVGPASGSTGGFQEVVINYNGSTTATMVMTYSTDGSVSRGIAGIYVSLVEFSVV